jgi:hypothetical protein
MAKSGDLERSQKAVALAPALLVAGAAVAAAIVSLAHMAIDGPEADAARESPAAVSPGPASGTLAGPRHSPAGAPG